MSIGSNGLSNSVAKREDGGAVDDTQQPKIKGFTLARIVAAFWLLGMCNNYIYVIMFSAAHDIIVHVEEQELQDPNKRNVTLPAVVYAEGRNCTEMSTGAILLADIIPTLVVKLLCPFLPFVVHFRIFLAVSTGILSLVLVAASESYILAIIGVCFASFNSGLGEITLLAYSTNFPLHAISGWSSGTGGAGLAGSFVYAGLAELGLSPSTILYISISVPTLMALSFWVILKHPKREKKTEVTQNTETQEKITLQGVYRSFIEKVTFIPEILHFMIPVGLVYYFEYLINSGLFDKIVFLNTTMSPHSQYRWYNAMYQIGVFVSRSSVTWVHFKKIWIMSLLQGLNLIIFMLEAIYGFVPNVWIMFVLIFWEGLLGGAAYVNTFYNMSQMVRKEYRLFALSIASVADTFGIVFAGLSSFPVHDFICNLPYNPVFRWPN
ncbi:UNVERIFIED_CONTAM: hypothetical protein PYX00_003106 [Menopon gallinae]|uniref:Battenin n=1 Tax=Menopon gallinae TaxID=328185 RepID=A0AAW2HZW9_9NEOP